MVVIKRGNNSYELSDEADASSGITTLNGDNDISHHKVSQLTNRQISIKSA